VAHRVDRYGNPVEVVPDWVADLRAQRRDRVKADGATSAILRRLPNASYAQLLALSHQAEPRTPGNIGLIADAARYYLERKYNVRP
jgi:hypothetical protein